NVEHLEYFAVNLLDPVAAVDEDQRAFQHLPSTQIIIDEEAPFPDDIPGRLGKAITWHVDEPEHERSAHVEIVEFLRPPRGHRSSREPVAACQRVEQRRLADI